MSEMNDSKSFDDLIAVEPAVDSSASKSTKRKPLLILTASIVALAAIVGGSYIGVTAYQSAQQEKADRIKIEEAKKAEEIKLQEIKEADNPLLILLRGKTPETPDSVTAVVDKSSGAVVGSDGSGFSISGLKLTQSLTPCTVTADTDMCFVGSGSISSNKLAVYLLKNATVSRLLEDPSNFREIKRTDGAVSASMSIDISGASHTVGVFTRTGGSSYVVLNETPGEIDSFDDIMRSAVVS